MNTFVLQIRRLYMLTLFCSIFGCTLLSTSNAAESFELYGANDLEKVFSDGWQHSQMPQTIDVFAVRNEIVSAQCVIHSAHDLRNVTVVIDAPVHLQTGGSLPASAVASYFIGSVPVPENTPNTLPRHLLRPAPADFPDPLLDARTLDIPAGRFQAVWVNIAVPLNAPAGEYRCKVRVQTDRGEAALPMTLTVYSVTLPDTRHINVTNWYSTNYFDVYHNCPEKFSERFFEILRDYANVMANARQNVFMVGLDVIDITETPEGRYTVDFARFDRYAETFWNTGRMDRLELGFTAGFGEGGRAGGLIALRPWKVTEQATGQLKSAPGERVIPQVLPALEDHLRAKGWLEKSMIHIADEPTPAHMRSWKQMSDFVHGFAPDIPRIDAIETVDFLGHLEVWVPKLTHLYTWFRTYKHAQSLGNELWYYTCMHPTNGWPNRFIDFALIKTRVLHWLNYRYNINGYLHWGLNQWRGYPSVGQYPGDAWIVYPKRDGLMSSIRWETMRNGLQDYELLWMLEDRYRAMGVDRHLEWFDPSQRSTELASRVVRDWDDYETDAPALYQVRQQVIEEILALDKRPLLVVQTNPPEGSKLLSGPIRILVQGWTEPGARVTINGEDIRVDVTGQFTHSAGLSPSRPAVEIAAKKENAVTRTTRSFQIPQD